MQRLPKRMCRLLFILMALPIVITMSARAQTIDLSIVGVQPKAQTMTIADLRKLPGQKVQVTNEKKQEGEYECTTLNAVLTQAGLQLGTAIRGKRLAEYAVVSARDGYSAVFALPELEPMFTDRTVFLCYAREGSALTGEEGPLRVVIPAEKRPARWGRQVSTILIKKDH